jgi:hypothetical protein
MLMFRHENTVLRRSATCFTRAPRRAGEALVDAWLRQKGSTGDREDQGHPR